MDPHLLLWGLFALSIAGFLVVDLGWLNRKPHKVTFGEAVKQSLFWIGLSLAFAGCVTYALGASAGSDFLSAYVTEKMLSVDNLFVILLLLRFFKTPEELYHRVLFWGVFGAIVSRGFFIFVGAAAIGHFHWILYLFGAFLVYTGWKLFRGGEDEEPDFEKNKAMLWLVKMLPIVGGPHGGKFFTRANGKTAVTILGLTLIMVEITDIMFATDSIPAVFAITHDPFLVFTSNLFAVMGLRSLFFMVESILTKVRFLQKALSFVLTFIGAKMLLDIWHVHISSVTSLLVILGTFVVAIIASLLWPEKK